MIGFLVYGKDNDSFAFRGRPEIREGAYRYGVHEALVPDMSGAARSGISRCPKCGELLAKWDEDLTGLIIKNRRYDISITYDGIVIISEIFQITYGSNALTGLTFTRLPDDPTFYSIRAVDLVKYDAERRGTRFENQCVVCGRFESVVGATPVCLRPGSKIPDYGFVRTDLEFASGDAKSPLLICGESAGKILNSAKLKGLDLIDL